MGGYAKLTATQQATGVYITFGLQRVKRKRRERWKEIERKVDEREGETDKSSEGFSNRLSESRSGQPEPFIQAA